MCVSLYVCMITSFLAFNVWVLLVFYTQSMHVCILAITTIKLRRVCTFHLSRVRCSISAVFCRPCLWHAQDCVSLLSVMYVLCLKTVRLTGKLYGRPTLATAGLLVCNILEHDCITPWSEIRLKQSV